MNLKCVLSGHDWHVGFVPTWDVGESDGSHEWIQENVDEMMMVMEHLPPDNQIHMKFCNRCGHVEAFLINNEWVNVGKAKANILQNIS